jgi:hypothetical protein
MEIGNLTKASAGSILLQAATEMSSRDANSRKKKQEKTVHAKNCEFESPSRKI